LGVLNPLAVVAHPGELLALLGGRAAPRLEVAVAHGRLLQLHLELHLLGPGLRLVGQRHHCGRLRLDEEPPLALLLAPAVR